MKGGPDTGTQQSGPSRGSPWSGLRKSKWNYSYIPEKEDKERVEKRTKRGKKVGRLSLKVLTGGWAIKLSPTMLPAFEDGVGKIGQLQERKMGERRELLDTLPTPEGRNKLSVGKGIRRQENTRQRKRKIRNGVLSPVEKRKCRSVRSFAESG